MISSTPFSIHPVCRDFLAAYETAIPHFQLGKPIDEFRAIAQNPRGPIDHDVMQRVQWSVWQNVHDRPYDGGIELARRWQPIARSYVDKTDGLKDGDYELRHSITGSSLHVAKALLENLPAEQDDILPWAYFHDARRVGDGSAIERFITKVALENQQARRDFSVYDYWHDFDYGSTQRFLFVGVAQYLYDKNLPNYLAHLDENHFMRWLHSALMQLDLRRLITDTYHWRGHYATLDVLVNDVRERQKLCADENRPLAVWLRAAHDPAGAMNTPFSAQCQRAGMRTLSYQIGDVPALPNALKESTKGQKISLLIIDAHGNAGELAWFKNKKGVLRCSSSEDISKALSRVKDRFTDGALILVASCHAATKPEDGLSIIDAIAEAVPNAVVKGFAGTISSDYFDECISVDDQGKLKVNPRRILYGYA